MVFSGAVSMGCNILLRALRVGVRNVNEKLQVSDPYSGERVLVQSIRQQGASNVKQ